MTLIDALEAIADGAILHMQHTENGKSFWFERGTKQMLPGALGEMLINHPDVMPCDDALFSDATPQSFKWRAPNEVD